MFLWLPIKIEVNNLYAKNIFLDDKDQYFLEVDIYFLIALDQWIDRSSKNVVRGGWDRELDVRFDYLQVFDGFS